MDIRPANIKLPAGIYVGLRHSTRSIKANKLELKVLRDNFSGLNASLLKQMPWTDQTLAERIKPVGKVKVPTELLSIGLKQVRSDDPVLLMKKNDNDYVGKMPSTFIELQNVMTQCFSNSLNTRIKFHAGAIIGEIDKKYVEKRGVLAWLDRFEDKPNSLGIYFMLNLFRYSSSDVLKMALPLKEIEIVNDFKTQGISLEDLTH